MLSPSSEAGAGVSWEVRSWKCRYNVGQQIWGILLNLLDGSLMMVC